MKLLSPLVQSIDSVDGAKVASAPIASYAKENTTNGAIVIEAPPLDLSGDTTIHIEIAGSSGTTVLKETLITTRTAAGVFGDFSRASTGTTARPVQWGMSPANNICIVFGPVMQWWGDPIFSISELRMFGSGITKDFARGWKIFLTNDLTGYTLTAEIPTNTITSNAATATKLATPRSITLAGDVTGSANFDGSANITITTTGGGGATPGGNTAEVQYNNNGVFDGVANLHVDGGDPVLLENNSPTTPTTGVKLFGRNVAGRHMLGLVGPSALDYVVQPSLWSQSIALWKPPGNATTVPGVFGFSAVTATGTATARNVTTADALSRSKRLGYVSAATAGSIGGQRSTTAQHTLGTGTGLGGFFYSCRFGVSDAIIQNAARTFVGLSTSTAAPTNVNPNTLNQYIGIGHSDGYTSWYIYYGGSSPMPPIGLGSNFPINNTDIIDISIFSPPNQNGVVYVYVKRITATGGSFSYQQQLGPGTLGTTLPLNTSLLAHRAWRTNNTSAAQVGIDILSVYIETDF